MYLCGWYMFNMWNGLFNHLYIILQKPHDTDGVDFYMEIRR